MIVDESTVQIKADNYDVIPESMLSVPKELEEKEAGKKLFKQHPSSVSDPGVFSFREECPPREYLSSPLHKGGYEGDKHPLLDKEDFLEIENLNCNQGN